MKIDNYLHKLTYMQNNTCCNKMLHNQNKHYPC